MRNMEMGEELKTLLSVAEPKEQRRISRGKLTGAWLTAEPSTLNGTELTCDEFRDSLRIRLGLVPQGLPDRCDGCEQRFTVGHALQCKVGGLIRFRHEEVAGEWHQLCAQALCASAVSDEPKIPTCQATGSPAWSQSELRGDVGAIGFWTRGKTAIFDVRVTDTDADSNRGLNPATVLRRQETEKKRKYGERCSQTQRHFTPLVFSVDGMEGNEAKAARKRLASRLAAKWKRQYSVLCGFVRARLSFALVRATSRCLRGTRDPYLKNSPSLEWVSGTGSRLFR